MAFEGAQELLRADLLRGVGVVVAGPEHASGTAGAAVAQACAALGARVGECRPSAEHARSLDEDAIAAAADAACAAAGTVDVLLVDGAALFADGGERALYDCLQASWSFTRALAQAMIAAGRGRVLLLAPAPDDGVHAGAARAGFENLARTLSIEWARHGLTALAIAPAPETAPAQLGALVAFLASPAGAYFSGCLLDLRGPQPVMPPNSPPVT